MKAFYGSRFSPNMTRTPEGYLICHNAPISRIGWQEYLGREIGLDGEYAEQVIQVYRDPEDVFDPATIASFEGKTVTDDHPNEEVRADNYSQYIRGTTTNVRHDEENTLADLIIYDPILQAEIESGKREISCGYTCEYEVIEEGKKYRQKKIRGNHVAVVESGRAGPEVAIKDSKTERSKTMGKFNPWSIFGKMKDASPEELEETAKLIAKANDSGIAPMPPKPTDEQPPAPGAAGGSELEARMAKIEAILEQLVKSDRQVHSQIPSNSLDELEVELEGGQNDAGMEGEESNTIPPEEIVGDEAGPVLEGEEIPKNPIPGADSAYVKNLIRTVKPILAELPADKRKAASDAVAKSLRGIMKNPAGQQKDGYNRITQTVRSAAAQDSKPVNDADLGKDWAKKFNPHYKDRI